MRARHVFVVATRNPMYVHPPPCWPAMRCSGSEPPAFGARSVDRPQYGIPGTAFRVQQLPGPTSRLGRCGAVKPRRRRLRASTLWACVNLDGRCTLRPRLGSVVDIVGRLRDVQARSRPPSIPRSRIRGQRSGRSCVEGGYCPGACLGGGPEHQVHVEGVSVA